MKIKGLKHFHKTLNNWLNKNGFDDIGIFLCDEFCANIDYKLVGYTLTDDIDQAELFIENARRLGLEVECGDFILSLFHEIGHIKTDAIIPRKLHKKCKKTKIKIEDTYTGAESDMEYFNLYDEQLATLWAISYINNNKKKIKKLNTQLQTIANKIALKNKWIRE